VESASKIVRALPRGIAHYTPIGVVEKRSLIIEKEPGIDDDFLDSRRNPQRSIHGHACSRP